MLPSSPEVKEVYSGEEGILDGIRAQSSSGTANEGASQKPLCIDCTTLDPEVAVQMAKLVKEAGGDMLGT